MAKPYKLEILQKIQHSVKLPDDQHAAAGRRNVVLTLAQGQILTVPGDLPEAEAEKLVGFGYARKA